MDNTVRMFDIPLFKFDGYYDEVEDGIQYHAIEWNLHDMDEYNDTYVVVFFDGHVAIYTSEGEKLFEDSLLKINSFREKLLNQIGEFTL